MPVFADFFSQEPFEMLNVTKALRKMPYQERMLGNMGLFNEGDAEDLATDLVEIDEENGKLQVIHTKPRGAPAEEMAKDEKRKARLFKVPHMPAHDRIYPHEIQNDRVTGEIVLDSAVRKVNDRLAKMRKAYELTREIHRLGSLKGQLLDADNTVIFDYFTEFEVSQTTDILALTTPTTDVRGAMVDYARTVEDLLGETTYTGLALLCGRDFFDNFVNNDSVKDTYKNWEAAQSLRADLRSGFPYGGMLVMEYRGTRGLANNIGIIEDNKAYVVPMGSDIFRTYTAPANFMSTVNTPGNSMVAKVVPDLADRWVDIHGDDNFLFMNTRPDTIIEVTGT